MYTVTVHGFTSLNRKLTGISRRTVNMSPVFAALEQDFYKMMRQQFSSQGARFKEPWAPLSSETIDRKRREHLSLKIGRASDQMFRSFTQGHGMDVRIDENEMEIETDVGHASIFHSGRGGRGRQRARTLFRWTRADGHRWTRAMGDYVMHGIIRVPG